MTKQLLINEDDRVAICEAADILRRIFQGHGAPEEEVQQACMGLLSIVPIPAPVLVPPEAS